MPAKILATVSIESNHILVATPRCPRGRVYCYSDKTQLFRTTKVCPDFVCLQTDNHLPIVVCAATGQDDIAIIKEEV
jgi:hypothetical protein